MWELQKLPLNQDVETKRVLKALPAAHAALAELKGLASSIPNQQILVNTLGIQEAKDSSAIENIVTTHDELYKSEITTLNSLQAKEVQNYVAALKRGYELLSLKGFISNNIIIEIQSVLEKNNAGFRKLPGTSLKNAITGEVIYTPPQEYARIQDLMENLSVFMNDKTLSSLDPIIKMAIIHFQFESIHPFYDGNGRTGRIINILFLILEKLLHLPILYMSSYIIKNKVQYYTLLQRVRDSNEWEEWLLYMIEAVRSTSIETKNLIIEIKAQMMSMKNRLRESYKFYSQDLLNNIFKHPYTKIEFLQRDLNVSRITAANYLNHLAKDGILQKEKLGNTNYYINTPLFDALKIR